MKRTGQLVPPEVHARMTERMSRIHWGSPTRATFIPPLGSGADRIPPAEQAVQQNVASNPALTEQELNRMLEAGLFDTDETPQIRDREVSTTKVATSKEPEADKSAAAEVCASTTQATGSKVQPLTRPSVAPVLRLQQVRKSRPGSHATSPMTTDLGSDAESLCSARSGRSNRSI